MCLIITMILFVMSITNLFQEQWLIGGIQLLISFGFLWLLLRNIKQSRCHSEGKSCEGMYVFPLWILTNKLDHFEKAVKIREMLNM